MSCIAIQGSVDICCSLVKTIYSQCILHGEEADTDVHQEYPSKAFYV